MPTFELTDAAEGATHLRSQTCALFPGARGQAYRASHRHPSSHRRHHPDTAIGPAAEPRTGLKPARQARPQPGQASSSASQRTQVTHMPKVVRIPRRMTMRVNAWICVGA